MSETDKARIDAQVRAMPPMTDKQIREVCDVIMAARRRQGRPSG